MKTRVVIVTIDTLVEILRDYLGTDEVPTDAKPITLRVNPAEKGKFAIVLEGPSIKADTMSNVHFDLRRVSGCGFDAGEVV